MIFPRSAIHGHGSTFFFLGGGGLAKMVDTVFNAQFFSNYLKKKLVVKMGSPALGIWARTAW
jgi:hypothetical protein